MGEPELGADFGECVEPGAGPGAGIVKCKRVEPGRHHRREPAIPCHGIDQVEDEEGAACGQRLEASEVGGKPDDLGGVAEPRESARHRLSGDDRVDLVGTALRRRMQNRDETCRSRHQARFRPGSSVLRLSP